MRQEETKAMRYAVDKGKLEIYWNSGEEGLENTLLKDSIWTFLMLFSRTNT